MSQRYADQGLVVLGIHSTKGAEEMEAFAKKSGIPFPIAADLQDRTKRAFGVDGNPDYYLVDRSGRLRFADLANREVERAVQALLQEPAGLHPALLQAGQTAERKDKRILILWGNAQRASAFNEVRRASPEWNTMLTMEYEFLHLLPELHPELAKASGVQGERAAGFTLSAMDAKGRHLGHLKIKDWVRNSFGDTDPLVAFLTKHRVPPTDAKRLWDEALQQAQKKNQRVLVHLADPFSGWSWELEALLARKGVVRALEGDYVLLKIDEKRHQHGVELARQLRGEATGTWPWLAITDAQGKVLISSDRPTDQGPLNIGCPVSAKEQAWFLHMIDATRQTMEPGQRAILEKELAAFGASAR